MPNDEDADAETPGAVTSLGGAVTLDDAEGRIYIFFTYSTIVTVS